MGRILAIDYGSKRTGIAVTDPLRMIATGLTTVASKDIVAFLKDYLSKEKVVVFVIGIPKRMNGKASHSGLLINNFIRHLERKFPGIPIQPIDERYTSKMASHALFMSGMKKKKRQKKETIDMISATIILQSYMEQQESYKVIKL